MAKPIILTSVITASDTDLLSGTRLQTVPKGGILTFQFLADLNDATNNYALEIQLPNGDVPISGQRVPGANPSLGGVLDERQLFQMSAPVGQGGHCVVSLTETGAAICAYRIVYTPA